MYLTEQNVHIFDWTKCTCIWLLTICTRI